MKIKRLAALTAALTMCAAVFAACGNDKTSGGAETTAPLTQSETETVSQTEEIKNEETEAPENTEGSVAETEETEAEGSSGGFLAEAAEAALEGVDWPFLERIEDPEIITNIFQLDAGNANYKDLLVMKCPISANNSELIIIEAEDVSAAEADLEERKAAAVGNAWYPDDAERAGASIVGTEGQYAYFIMGSDPEKVEYALIGQLQ